MPELPEVQTVVNSLNKYLINKEVISYHELWHKVNYSKNSNRISKQIDKSLKIIEISRLGKYIIIKLNKNFLAFHLRMTGYLYHADKLPKKKRHLRCYFLLKNNEFLIFEDIRKFGGFYYLNNLKSIKDKLGIDPILDNDFSTKWLSTNIFKFKRKIKALLLDQKFITGLGNIYIDEILWKSKIHPERLSDSLSNIEIKNLHSNIIAILKKSIEFHGTTIINFKFDNMKTGNYKTKLNAYGRENLDCKYCSRAIIKRKICSRSTYFCISCQRI